MDRQSLSVTDRVGSATLPARSRRAFRTPDGHASRGPGRAAGAAPRPGGGARRDTDAAAQALKARARTLFPPSAAASEPQTSARGRGEEPGAEDPGRAVLRPGETESPVSRSTGRGPARPLPAVPTSTDRPAGSGRAGRHRAAPDTSPGGTTGSRTAVPARRAGRLWWAVRERLPLWVQLRCGMEPRTLVALVVVLVACLAFAAHHYWTGRPRVVRAPTAEPAAAREIGAGTAGPPATASGAGPAGAVIGAAGSAGRVVVDVTGKVRDPGVHTLPAGARVADALREAGGVRPGTDTSGLNRARLLVDGEHIVVGAPAGGAGAAAPGGAGASGGPAGAGGAPGTPVSLNTATLEQLDTLPGVGPVLARHILDYRTQHGGFRSVDQLRDVTGIGERRFADLRPLVRP